ncbi:MAG: hypothetical protein E7579_01255 [Ruminococcaceae bacterium]|nr:hypothetical protein [Oscillospiraceae bacterium]
MVTAIYSFPYVHGAEIWLLLWLLGVIGYLGICLMIKPNRTKNGVRTTIIGLLIAEVIVDLVWAVIYYPNGTYFNYGIGGISGWFLGTPVLGIIAVIVTALNSKNEI